jgi:hypothetical protein
VRGPEQQDQSRFGDSNGGKKSSAARPVLTFPTPNLKLFHIRSDKSHEELTFLKILNWS